MCIVYIMTFFFMNCILLLRKWITWNQCDIILRWIILCYTFPWYHARKVSLNKALYVAGRTGTVLNFSSSVTRMTFLRVALGMCYQRNAFLNQFISRRLVLSCQISSFLFLQLFYQHNISLFIKSFIKQMPVFLLLFHTKPSKWLHTK